LHPLKAQALASHVLFPHLVYDGDVVMIFVAFRAVLTWNVERGSWISAVACVSGFEKATAG
jgi:hypothetical protein